MYNEAIKFYKESIDYENDKDSKKSMYLFIGNAYNNLKEYEDSINAYQNCISLASGDDKGNFYKKIADIYYFNIV